MAFPPILAQACHPLRGIPVPGPSLAAGLYPSHGLAVNGQRILSRQTTQYINITHALETPRFYNVQQESRYTPQQTPKPYMGTHTYIQKPTCHVRHSDLGIRLVQEN